LDGSALGSKTGSVVQVPIAGEISPITLIDAEKGELKAQTCAIAWFLQLACAPARIGREKNMSAGKWRHNMCVACFRKRWPRRKIWPHQIPPDRRVWEQCCFCATKDKDGIQMKKDPRSKELRCAM